jgi:hypothetical protein
MSRWVVKKRLDIVTVLSRIHHSTPSSEEMKRNIYVCLAPDMSCGKSAVLEESRLYITKTIYICCLEFMRLLNKVKRNPITSSYLHRFIIHS